MGGTPPEGNRAKGGDCDRMKLVIHIERLVLDGLPSSAQGPALQAALERELAGLLAQRPLTALSSGAMPHLAAPAIKLAAGSRPAQWGRQIAQSLCTGLMPPRDSAPKSISAAPGTPAA